MIRRVIRRLALTGILLACWLLVAGSAKAQEPPMDGLVGGSEPWEVAHDTAMLAGREAYNAEDFQRARQEFLRAAQTLPERPAAYRNLARAHFWLGNYSRATRFYDVYLEIASGAADAGDIEEERAAAVARATDDPGPDASQEMALRSLRREIDEGRGYTVGGGGAWGLYRTLLRMGYAEPALAELQRELWGKIALEFERDLEPDDGILPVLTREEWTLQEDRLDALEELTRRRSDREMVDRRRLVVETARDLLDGRYGRAGERALEATLQNGDLPYVGFYRVVALERSRRPDDALSALDGWAGEVGADGDPLVRVFRGQLLQQLDRSDEAATIFKEILR